MTIAPLLLSSTTIRSSSREVSLILPRFVAICPSTLSSSMLAPRFRLPGVVGGETAPFTLSWTFSASIVDFRSISKPGGNETGLDSRGRALVKVSISFLFVGNISHFSDIDKESFTRGFSSSSSTTVKKLSSLTPSSLNFFSRLSSRSGS